MPSYHYALKLFADKDQDYVRRKVIEFRVEEMWAAWQNRFIAGAKDKCLLEFRDASFHDAVSHQFLEKESQRKPRDSFSLATLRCWASHWTRSRCGS